jgi:NAD(P)H-hydrate epimerase
MVLEIIPFVIFDVVYCSIKNSSGKSYLGMIRLFLMATVKQKDKNMQKILSVAEMRALEKEADSKGYTYAMMMDKAGTGLADLVESLCTTDGDKFVLALVGSGNNGGDALVALNSLVRKGWPVRAYIVRARDCADPLVLSLVQDGGVVTSVDSDPDLEILGRWLDDAQVVIDGVLGTGVELPLKPEIARVLNFVKNFVDLPLIIAVDCPSGINCDTGETAEECVPADLTVCMQAVKKGLLNFPGFEKAGHIDVIDLEMPDDLVFKPDVDCGIVRGMDILDIIPERKINAHKGTFGTALVLAGSINYTGAAYLAGKSAYRIGAGLVQMGVVAPVHMALAGQLPEATWIILPQEMGVFSENAFDVLIKQINKVDALLLGPGWGQEDTTLGLLKRLIGGKTLKSRRTPIGFSTNTREEEKQENYVLPPLVVDADALKLLAKISEWYKLLPENSVLTPHPGEMAVLTGMRVEDIQKNRLEVAVKYAKAWGQVVVLKGALTVVASPNLEVRVIPVATPALARAGTGDVLAGIITGLIAQGIKPFEAALSGAWIHAEAGVTAAEQVGHPASVLASDVIEAIPTVLNELGV